MLSPALTAAAFGFLSAVFFGLNPVVAKKGLERGGTSVQAAMVVITTTAVLVWAGLLATEGLAAFSGFSPLGVGVFLLGGVVGTTLGRLTNFAGIDRIGASVSTAVMNTRPFFAVALAAGFLGEPLTLTTAGGVLFIVVGVVVLSLAKGGDIRGWETTDLVFPVVAAFFFGAGNVIRRLGFLLTPATTLEALTLNETAALITLGAYFLTVRRDRLRTASRAAVPYFVLSGAIVTCGLAALFVGLGVGPVVVVDPLMGMAPLFSTLFTYLFLREVEIVTPGVVVGAVLIVVGGGLVTI